MNSKATLPITPEAWDAQALEGLIDELWSLRESILERQSRMAPWLREVEPAHRASAINLTHYLALRQTDLRHLQDRLAWMGVSSLGRAECVMLNKGPHILRRMQAHQSKKRPLLRALKAWDLPLAALVD